MAGVTHNLQQRGVAEARECEICRCTTFGLFSDATARGAELAWGPQRAVGLRTFHRCWVGHSCPFRGKLQVMFVKRSCRKGTLLSYYLIPSGVLFISHATVVMPHRTTFGDFRKRWRRQSSTSSSPTPHFQNCPECKQRTCSLEGGSI